MTAVIELTGVTKRFGGVVAVDDVALTVPAGQRHAVIGPNGAGKSTLLSIIAGAQRPTSGHVTLLGTEVSRWPAHRVARLGVSRTFQHSGRFPEESVFDNCLLAACMAAGQLVPLGRDRRLRDVAANAVDVVELGDRANETAGALSHGEARQLEIAMALAAQPRVLLADEPLAGLSEHERATVGRLLRTLSRDVTMLFIEHDLEYVLGVADEITVLDFGSVISRGDAAAIRADPKVAEIYLGDAASARSAADAPPDAAGTVAVAPSPTSSSSSPPPPSQPVPSTDVALAVRALRSGYGGTAVIEGVDLDALRGRTVAVLGRNGMGKSTLLNTIMGSVAASAGSVELAGQDLSSLPAVARSRAGLALVPQGRGILPGLTVSEQLLVGCRDGRWTPELVYELFPVLHERRRQFATTLSGGEQQMLAIGRALLRNPAVLLLDEPSEGLAPLLVRRVGEIVGQLAAEGECIVLAEQNVRMAVSVADDVVVLDRGRITHRGPAAELRDDPARQRELLGL